MSRIRTWLDAIGLGQYADAFEAEQVSIANLAELTDSDLKDLGLPLGPRKTLLKACKTLDIDAEPARAVEAESAPAPRAAERRQITVMFCDLVGSTLRSEQLDPEDLRTLMQGYQQACGTVIARYEGHVTQYLGDGLMTYFGWPLAHEDDAERAVRVARARTIEHANTLALTLYLSALTAILLRDRPTVARHKLHGVRTELHASLSRASEAEAAYRAALAVAREQKAKWWELRAAVSLARRWQGQSKVAEARELLAPIYDWFTEGFDTEDLKEAKALLDELNA